MHQHNPPTENGKIISKSAAQFKHRDSMAAIKTNLRLRYGRNLAVAIPLGRCNSQIRAQASRTARQIENMLRTNSRPRRRARKRRKGRLLSRPFRPLMALGGTLRITRPTIASARWWAFAAPTAILSFYLCSVPFISSFMIWKLRLCNGIMTLRSRKRLDLFPKFTNGFPIGEMSLMP